MVVEVDHVQSDRQLDRQVPLHRDAHHQVGLAAQEDCLDRVPEVGEQPDVQLVLEVEVGVEAVHHDHDDEEEVDHSEGDDGLVEVGVEAVAQENDAHQQVSDKAHCPHR